MELTIISIEKSKNSILNYFLKKKKSWNGITNQLLFFIFPLKKRRNKWNKKSKLYVYNINVVTWENLSGNPEIISGENYYT